MSCWFMGWLLMGWSLLPLAIFILHSCCCSRHSSGSVVFAAPLCHVQSRNKHMLLLLPLTCHSPHLVWSLLATSGALHMLQDSLVCPSSSTYAPRAAQGLQAILL